MKYLFWLVTLLGFTFGLGGHLSKRYFPKKPEAAQSSSADEKGNWVGVAEEKDPSPEETRPLPEISPEELAFRERAGRVLEDFPRKTILKHDSRDLHKPPPELTEASAELGAIEDLLDKNPQLLREGLRFYRKCALEDSLLSSLRALCLHNLKTRAEKSGWSKKINWDQFPERLHRIADRLK